MLTIFSIPKPFDQGHISVIQRNAIESWLRLEPACEVILCGNDLGVAEIAAELGVQHIPDIARNAYGTPLLSDAFKRAQALAHNALLCYVNADIIFLPDLTTALRQIKFPRFLLVGQRWNIDIPAPIEFTPGWEPDLRAKIASQGKLERFDYIDYFVFPTDTPQDLPDFAVGRPGWDNWMIYHARSLQWPVIDATQAITAVHQNHNYNHVPMRTGDRWEGPEGDQNRALMGGKAHRFYVTDATHKLTHEGLTKALDDVYLEQRASRQVVLNRRTNSLARFIQRAVGWVSRHRSVFPGWLWRQIIDKLAQ